MNGLLSIRNSVKDMYDDLNEFVDSGLALHTARVRNYYKDNLLVNVNGGRKYKGLGYLVGYVELCSDYGLELKAQIYDPVHNEIREVNPQYVQLHESYAEDFRYWMAKVIEEKLEEFPEKFTRLFSLNAHTYFEEYLHLRKNFIDIPEDVRQVEKEIREEKKIKRAEELARKRLDFKASKMTQLIKWAQEVAGKQGDEAIALAERIWKKKYE